METGSCPVRDSIEVVLIPYSEILGDDTAVCPGHAVTFVASTAFQSYIWNDASTGSVLVTSQPGEYHVTATDSSQCTVHDTVHLSNHSPVEFQLGSEVTFCDTAWLAGPAGNIASVWSTGSTSSTLTVNQPGNYELTVTSAKGCTSVEAINVIRECSNAWEAPNAFTPNGDGINDVPHLRKRAAAEL